MSQSSLSILACALLCCTASLAQTPPPGEKAKSDLSLFFIAGGKGVNEYVPFSPWPEHTIGLSYLGQEDPTQQAVAWAGELSAVVPAGKKFVLGFEASLVYASSPGPEWSRFGDYVDQPVKLRSDVDYPKEFPQDLHVDPAFMWEDLGGDPSDPAAWAALGPEHDTPNGIGGLAYLNIVGPDRLFNWALRKVSGRIPIKTPGALGPITGINLVLQLGILEGNGANGVPEVNLSNAIVLTVTPGPTLLVNINGGNNGEPGDVLSFDVTQAVPGMTVVFPRVGGGVVRRTATMTSGSTIEVTIPPQASSGALGFASPTLPPGAEVPTGSPVIPFVRRFGPLIRPHLGDALTWNAFTYDGLAIRAMTVFGIATGGNFNVTLPPALPNDPNGSLVVDLYTYAPSTDLVGFRVGNSFPLSLNVQPVGVSIAVPLVMVPNSGQVQVVTDAESNTSSVQQVSVGVTNANLPVLPFFAVIRFTPNPVQMVLP